MHPDTFNGEWKDRIEYGECKQTMYHKDDNGLYRGYFWGLNEVYAKKYDCLNVAGTSLIMADFLKKLDARSVFVPKFEELMHIHYGDGDFYKVLKHSVITLLRSFPYLLFPLSFQFFGPTDY